MKFRQIRILLLVLTMVAVFGATSLQATPVTIDFGTGLAGSGGTVIFNGANASGSNILIGTVTVLNAPVNNGGYTVNGTAPCTDNGCSPAFAGVLNFDTSANYINIMGSIPGLGIGQSTLLTGTFNSFSVCQVCGAVSGGGQDFKSKALLNALGLPADTQFAFFGFTLSSAPGDARQKAQSTDISNTSVPEPASLLLLVMGSLGLLVLAVRSRKLDATK